MKRLLFEFQTLLLASLKDQITASQSTIKRVPVAEREARMEVIKGQLTGLLLEGNLEPGHVVLDLAASMFQRNEIRYIPPERAFSRVHEVVHYKAPTIQLDIASDSLVLKETQKVCAVAANSAMQVSDALIRRGVALLFGDLIDFGKYQKYLQPHES